MGLNDRILLVGKYLVAIRKQNTAKKKIANEIWKEHKVWQTEQVKEVAHVTINVSGTFDKQTSLLHLGWANILQSWISTLEESWDEKSWINQLESKHSRTNFTDYIHSVAKLNPNLDTIF